MNEFDLYLSAKDTAAIVETELTLHPNLELIDIYKLIYQAFYGPAHIVQNVPTVVASIYSEVMDMKDSYFPLYQDIGNKQGFWRLSLGWLLPDKLQGETALRAKAETLAELMLLSIPEIPHQMSIAERWNLESIIIKELFTTSETAWQEVNAMVLAGQIPSHSLVYKQAYNPHYRLIHPCVSDKLLQLMS
jgi:hypothetical protein